MSNNIFYSAYRNEADSDSNADASEFASASITPHSIASFSPANDSPFGGVLGRASVDDGFAVPSYPPSASASPGGTPEEFPSMFARRLSLQHNAKGVGHSHLSVARQLKVDVAPQPAIIPPQYPQQQQQQQQQQPQQFPAQPPAAWEFDQAGLLVDDGFQGGMPSVSGMAPSPFTTNNSNNMGANNSSFDIFGNSSSSIFTPVDAGLPYGSWPLPSPSPLSASGAFFFNTVDVQARPSKKAKHFGSMNMNSDELAAGLGANAFQMDDPASENCPPQTAQQLPNTSMFSSSAYPSDAKTYGDLLGAAPSCNSMAASSLSAVGADLPEPPQSGLFQSSRISPRQWPASSSPSNAAASGMSAPFSVPVSSNSPRLASGSSYDMTSAYLQQLPPLPAFVVPSSQMQSSVHHQHQQHQHHQHQHQHQQHQHHQHQQHHMQQYPGASHMSQHHQHNLQHHAHPLSSVPLPPPPPHPHPHLATEVPASHGHAHGHSHSHNHNHADDDDCDSLGYSDDDDRSDAGDEVQDEVPGGQVYGLHKLAASQMSPYRAMSHNPSLCNSECSSPCQSRASSAPTSPGPSGRKKRYRVNHACATCKKSKTKCDNQRPCERCVRTGRAESCIDSVHKKRGRKKKTVKRKLRTKMVPTTGSLVHGNNGQVKEEEEDDEADFDDGYDSPSPPPLPSAGTSSPSAPLPVRRAISFHSSSATASPQSSTSSLGLPPLPRATSDS